MVITKAESMRGMLCRVISLSALKSKRGDMCEWCGKRVATERHHIFYHRMKSKPELDDERNLLLCCHDCHQSGKVNNRFAREWFWMRQSERYNDMLAWHEGLPLKVKEQWG